MTSFRLVLHSNGHGQVLVGDTDLSGVAGSIALDARPGQPPRLVVELIGEADVEGIGDVTVLQSADHLVDFLRSVDSHALEKEALSRLESFDDRSTTEVMLTILAEWAQRHE